MSQDEIVDIERMLDDLTGIITMIVQAAKSGNISMMTIVKMLPLLKDGIAESKLAMSQIKNLQDPGQKEILFQKLLTCAEKIMQSL